MFKFNSFQYNPLQRDKAYLAGSTIKLFWLLRLRWIAVVFLALVIIPAQKLALLRSNDLPLYGAILLVLVVLNICSQFFYKKLQGDESYTVLFQLSTDVLCLSLLLSLMGGAWNPMTPLLYFHAALGALLLSGISGWIFFSILVFCFISLNAVIHLPPILEASPIPRYIQLPCQLLVVFAIWMLTGWVSRKLNFLGKKAKTLEDQKNRMDRLRAAGALAAGFSHEFATPLNTLKLRIERIFRKHPVNEQDQQVSLESLEHCENILKKMSATHSAKEGIRLEEVKVGAFCQDVIKSWNEANPKFTVELNNELEGDELCVLAPLPFTNTLLNLFDNSKEANAKEIQVSLQRRETSISIVLLDSGSGWPDQVKKHFGEPFISLKERGSGLGLYNSKTLAEALGGSLNIFDARTAPYLGAGIHIQIPILTRDNP